MVYIYANNIPAKFASLWYIKPDMFSINIPGIADLPLYTLMQFKRPDYN